MKLNFLVDGEYERGKILKSNGVLMESHHHWLIKVWILDTIIDSGSLVLRQESRPITKPSIGPLSYRKLELTRRNEEQVMDQFGIKEDLITIYYDGGMR